MAVQAENVDRAISATIRLEALEARAAVMQRMRRRVQRQRAGGLKLKGGPSAILVGGDRHHVAEHAAKRRATWVRLAHQGIIGDSAATGRSRGPVARCTPAAR